MFHQHHFKKLKYGLAGLVVLIPALSLAMMFFLQHSLPSYQGHENLPGLSREVRVVRDNHAVPHIFAANMNDAARALGYVHASERMFQMEMQRRAGQGRLSEVVGSDMLDVDKFIRTLGIYALAENSVAAFSPGTLQFFQAYADGVNAWLETHRNKLPPEFTLLHLTPEPWKVADSVVWGKLMALQLSTNFKIELLRWELSQKLTPAMMKVLFPTTEALPITMLPHSILAIDGEKSTPSFKDNQRAPKTKPQKSGMLLWPDTGVDEENTLGAVTGLDHAASNEWVISGARTESGKPILANDPHLGLEAPILWYLARIVTPDIWIKGATVPGLPIVLLGQNDHIAWGFTTTYSDTQDLYLETVDPKDPSKYLTPDGSKPFLTRSETIHVKHGRDVVLNVRATRHGPVVSDINENMAKQAGSGRVMALAFTALETNDTTSEALLNLNRARNWDEFLGALRNFKAPTQNMVYADIMGHIGFINPGLVPVRKKGDGLMPVDGSSGAYDWVGMIPFTYLPHLYDPKAGFVFNANNTVTNEQITPYFMSRDWEEAYRARRLQYFFDTIKEHSLDTTSKMQADVVSLAALDLLPYLRRISSSDEEMRHALNLLSSWDGQMNKDRPEPLIFETWLYEMHKKLLVETAGVSLEEKGPYLASVMTTILESDDKTWCGKDGCQPVIEASLQDALTFLRAREGNDMSAWRWGHEHIATLKNKVFSHVPLLSFVSDLSVPSNGSHYTLDRGEDVVVDPKHPFLRRHGGGYRGVYDLGDPAKSRFMIATGQSGHILSPHYGDFVPLWNDNQYVTLTGTHDELIQQGGVELLLSPSP